MATNITRLAKRNETHILRKLWHVSFGSVCLGIYYSMNVEISFWGYFAVTFAVAGFLSDLVRLNNKSVNTLVIKVAGPLMRNSEEDSFTGLPFYALGVGLSILLFDEKIAVLSIFFLVFADPIASYVGVNFGRGQIVPNKSLEGTVAAFVTCNLLTIAFLYNSTISDARLIVFSIVAGIVGALAELASAFNIDDNLTIPVLSGAGLTLLNSIFQIF
jgi:dolichol kinase